MKFKGQGKINICGFKHNKTIADSRRGGDPKKTVSAPAGRFDRQYVGGSGGGGGSGPPFWATM